MPKLDLTTTREKLKAAFSGLSPQAARVLDHLIEAGSITNIEANAVLRVRSVSRRITEIGDALYFYGSEFVIAKEQKRDTTGQRYVRYNLVKVEERDF